MATRIFNSLEMNKNTTYVDLGIILYSTYFFRCRFQTFLNFKLSEPNEKLANCKLIKLLVHVN